MHNAAFAATGYNGIYAAIRVKDIRPAMAGMRALGLKGASITIPHKETVLPCLDYIDPAARRIKAVNTVLNHDGALKGFNTDCDGVIQALSEKISIKGRRVGILGAGGAARAVAFGVVSQGATATIYNRTEEKGEALAADFRAEFRPYSEFDAEALDILINTTPVGMFPQEQDSPLTAEKLKPGLVVMDIVYTPLKTRLLREAEAAGCEAIDGLSMFVHQGVRQFELWTGLEAPVEIMRMAVEAELKASF
jgi:shikimate dehydrogenase